uniref:Uncharacterized protein n=1 Tax=Peronospora matthiolae TaxID=2874970 RepID=A0AAV1TSS7_9STRA
MEALSGRSFGKEAVTLVDKSTLRRTRALATAAARWGTSWLTVAVNGPAVGTVVVAAGVMVHGALRIEGKERLGLRALKKDLAIKIGDDGETEAESWILDSVFSLYLVKNPTLEHYAQNFEVHCHIAGGKTIRLKRVDNVVLTVLVKGKQQNVTLNEVFLAPELARNVIAQGKLEYDFLALSTMRRRGFWQDSDGAK